MAVSFDIMNMMLIKRHCLLERVWKRLSARCASQFCGRFCPDEGAVAGYDNRIRVNLRKWGVQIVGMIFRYALGMMSFLREILYALEVRVCLKKVSEF